MASLGPATAKYPVNQQSTMTQQFITFAAFEARGSRLAQIKDQRLHPIGHILFITRKAFPSELQPLQN